MVATSKNKLNPIEKEKAKKHPLLYNKELKRFASMGWEALESENDFALKQGLKWLGFFYRPVHPGYFMLRMRIPNGILSSSQMRTLADIVQRYATGQGQQTEGNADLTTRQNIQLRCLRLEDIPDIVERLTESGLTSIQSGMDNVRNITGSPVAGIDADELIDTRGLVRNIQDMITSNSGGNLDLSNLPQKTLVLVPNNNSKKYDC